MAFLACYPSMIAIQLGGASKRDTLQICKENGSHGVFLGVPEMTTVDVVRRKSGASLEQSIRRKPLGQEGARKSCYQARTKARHSYGQAGNRNYLHTKIFLRFHKDFAWILQGFKASEGSLGGPRRS